MKYTEIEPQVKSVRSLLQDIYEKISQQGTNELLPSPDAAVKAVGSLIHQEQYDVVVCGEVKKGKSSFINALMGEEVLPTNTQVATSQVCRIINSDIEEYNLVFTDGSRQPISKQELSRYGSQVDADMYGEPIFRDHQLDYIEVKHPLPNLPKSVALVDTPGIGAVYAAHEQITRNYLKKAAAVIFIIDPKNPIVKPERDFVESALKVTKQIMFVMTKMDNYDENVIATMISRDEEILAPLASLTATKKIEILPISSTLLFDATKEKDELLLEMSRFDDIKEALLKMIYNTIGFEVNAQVFNILNNYNTRAMNSLKELQMAASSQPSVAKEIAEKKFTMQQEFMRDWGANGVKIREINEAIKQPIRGLENEARNLFSQTHYIYKNMAAEVENLSNLETAKRLSETMGARLSDAYGKAWKDIIETCAEQIESVLADYNAHLCGMDEAGIYVSVESFQKKSKTLAEHISSGRNSYFSGAFITTALAIPLAFVVAAPIALAVAALFGIGAGVVTHRDSELKQYKLQLKEHLNKCFSQIHAEFLIKPQSEGLTRLQEAEEDLQHSAQKAMEQIFNQHKANNDKQLQLLEEQAQADAEKRKQKLAEITQLQQQWIPITNGLKQAQSTLLQLDQIRKAL